MTGRALLHTLCDSDPARFGSMGGRFKAPVLPGQRLDVHMWDDGDRTLFQTQMGDRVVFDAGRVHHPLKTLGGGGRVGNFSSCARYLGKTTENWRGVVNRRREPTR